MAYSNGYTYRKKITVDPTKVSGSGSLTDFPFLISHTDTALKTVANSGKVENSNGYDIRFETSGGTELDYERIIYVATTGQIIAWVQATLDGTSNTEIYLYYGNSSISTDQSDPTGTWDSNFKGTWHMIEDPSGSSPQLLDSTSNNYDMTTAGSMTSGDLVTGQIYKGIDFDGSNDEAKNTSWSSVISGNASFSIEHWFKISSTPNAQMVAWGESGGSNLCSTGTYGNNIGFLGYANDHVYSAADYDDGAWHHLAVTHNGTTVKVLLDGVEKVSDSMTLGTNTGQDLYFARWKDGGFYPAVLEEIRISDTARSNDWMITTYETAKNPSTFYSLGTEETSGGTSYDLGSGGAAVGTFTQTGQSANLSYGTNIPSSVGAFNLTGQDTGLSYGAKVTPEAGVFVQAGQDAGLSFGTGIANEVGAFTLTGQDAGLAHGTSVGAGAGVYSLSGQDALLSFATTLALETGVLTLTGNNVAFAVGYTLVCEPESYTLTGNDVTFNLGLTMVVEPGAFAITGQDTGLSHGTNIAGETGTFALTGQNASLSSQYVILTDAGGFLLTGQDAALTFAQIMSAEVGAYTLAGNDAAFPVDYKINPETGTFTLTGNNANLNFSSPSGAGNIIIGIAI